MIREYFLKTNRVGFSMWNKDDFELANQLWGEKEVTQFICATGQFTHQDIMNRLKAEINYNEQHSVQYWPIFDLDSDALVGCCGIHPFKTELVSYELGFHLRKKYWGMGYASEAAITVIKYSFRVLKAAKLYAGHHPQNKMSERLLAKLGFQYIGNNFYEPTGLDHPSYELNPADYDYILITK